MTLLCFYVIIKIREIYYLANSGREVCLLLCKNQIKNLFIVIFICWLMSIQQSFAIDQFITVTFNNQVNEKFLQVINLMVGTTIYEKQGEFKYQLKIPKMRNVDEYAELFSALAYVKEVSPLPKQKWEDNIEPMVFDYTTIQRPSGVPIPQSPPLPSPSNNKNNIHVVTQIPITRGNEIFIDYKSGISPIIPDLFNLIFETKLVEKRTPDSYRLRIPPNLKPQAAARIYKLCPYVINVEPTYGR